MKKVTAFIPIKLNNERTPGKNTRTFSDGTPLCHFIQRSLLQVPEIDDIVVFCSEAKIQDYILPGVRYMPRPSSLDSSSTLYTDLIRGFIESCPSDIYVMTHATSPFVRPERFSECIQAVLSGEHDSAFIGKRVMDYLWKDGEPLNFCRDHIPRTQDLECIYRETSGAYVFTKEVFERYRGRIGRNPHICACGEIESIDIDWPEDFMIAEAVYEHIIKKQQKA